MIPGMQPMHKKIEQINDATARPEVPAGAGWTPIGNGAGAEPDACGTPTVFRHTGQMVLLPALPMSHRIS